MKKLINDVDDVLTESLDGFAAAHADIVTLGDAGQFVRRTATKPGKVALISGGGSGHEPLHAGFVGHGMLDAACPGQVFTSPTPDQMLAAAQAVDTGAGVLFIVKNYSGDMMNFQMAAEMLDCDNATVIVNDDVAVENSTYTTGRRGVAGTLIVEKIVGAAAERGDRCAAEGARRRGQQGDRVDGRRAHLLHRAGGRQADLPDRRRRDGDGRRHPRRAGPPPRQAGRADDIAAELAGAILKDLSLKPGQEVLLLVNGFGGTPLMELYLMVNAVHKVLAAQQVKVARYLTGSYVTSLEMAGCSVTVSAVDAAQLALWDAPVHTAALRWGM